MALSNDLWFGRRIDLVLEYGPLPNKDFLIVLQTNVNMLDCMFEICLTLAKSLASV